MWNCIFVWKFRTFPNHGCNKKKHIDKKNPWNFKNIAHFSQWKIKQGWLKMKRIKNTKNVFILQTLRFSWFRETSRDLTYYKVNINSISTLKYFGFFSLNNKKIFINFQKSLFDVNASLKTRLFFDENTLFFK